MKFLHRRKPGPTEEAVAALRRAEAAEQRADVQAPRIRAVVKSLREVQERNHLAEAFEHALLRGPR